MKHGVAPATVCLRRAMKSSRVELGAGRRRRGLSRPPAASLLRALSSEDEDEGSPGAPPLPSAGCMRSAACMIGPGARSGARYWNAPEPDSEPDSEPAPLWPFVSADAGDSAAGSATASTRAMVVMTDLCHGVAGTEGIAHGPTQVELSKERRHEEGKTGSGAGSGLKCGGPGGSATYQAGTRAARPTRPIALERCRSAAGRRTAGCTSLPPAMQGFASPRRVRCAVASAARKVPALVIAAPRADPRRWTSRDLHRPSHVGF